jgi:hypothetical protein
MMAQKPPGSSLGGPGGYQVNPMPSVQINPHTGMPMTPQMPPQQQMPPPPPFGMSPMQFGNAPGNVMGFNQPMSIPGMYGAQQDLVNAGHYAGQQPGQMTPEFLKALSMVGLSGMGGSTNPSQGNGSGGQSPDTMYAGGTPGFYPGMTGYGGRLVAGLPTGGGMGSMSGFGGNSPALPPLSPLPQRPMFTPPTPFAWGARTDQGMQNGVMPWGGGQQRPGRFGGRR